jgi:hypothetical protein
MNDASANPVSPRSPLRTILLSLAGITAVCFIALAAAVLNAITLTRDAAALRNGLLDTVNAHAGTRVQVSAGPLLLGTARIVTSFISEIPEEARLGLRAVRKASVGVYEIPRESLAANHARMMRVADERMVRRGWSRGVAVNDHDNLVLIYLPKNGGGGRTQHICLAVCDDDKLVVVAGTIATEPLAKLIAEKGGFARLRTQPIIKL